MILKRFRATKVFGYLEFDFNLQSDVNFLVGGNGSGKTTAIKLINGLLVPNFRELMTIPFETAILEIEHKNESIEISALSDDSKIELSVSSVDEKLLLPNYSDIEIEYYTHKSNDRDELIEEVNRKNSNTPVVKRLAEIPSPIFLGLDRRKDQAHNEKSIEYFTERELWMVRKSNNRAIRARRLINGSLGASLMETELLVQDAYRRLRHLEERQSEKLRDSILLSAFSYTEFKFDEEKLERDFWNEKAVFLKRKKEIKDALSKIGVKDSRLSSEVDTFFDRLTKLFESIPEAGEKGFNIELLTNKAQIERIANIVEVIDEYKSKIDKLFKPINEFIQTVNSFYSDSNKTLSVDTVGQLVVDRPDGKKCTIEGLSSGERQLLVIFAHAFFNRYNERNTVFIIDEPELSLHLRWQEKFSETILAVSPNAQFLMATHSPEIIGEYKNKAVKCR
ncbi:AAA family ATPase [Sessilibacter sp. MAH4]